MAKQIFSKKAINIIYAIGLIVAGVLFCFHQTWGSQTLSIIFGSLIILMGIISVMASIAAVKGILTNSALVGGLLITFGIYFIAKDGVDFILALVPYLFIVFGAIILADAFLLFFMRNKGNVTMFIVELLCGIALATVGILLVIPVNGFKNIMTFLFGIAIAIYGIILFVKAIDVKKKSSAKKAKTAD